MPLTPQDTSAQGSRDVRVVSVEGTLDPKAPFTDLRLEDGRVVRLLTVSLLDAVVNSSGTDQRHDVTAETNQGDAGIVVPVVEERLLVGKRLVETGKVRLRKTVQEYDTSLDETLAVRTYDVERVVLNQPIESVPGVRLDGETTVYPIVEEQLIVTRQLVLKEELRITRRDTERQDTRSVTLRREMIEVEREPTRPSPDDELDVERQ